MRRARKFPRLAVQLRLLRDYAEPALFAAMRRDFGEAGACEARRYLFLAADGHVVHHVGPLRALGVGLVVRDQESPAGLQRAQNLRE